MPKAPYGSILVWWLRKKGQLSRDKDKPVCRECGGSVLAKGSNTSNLFQHSCEHHPQLYADVGPSVSKSKDKSDGNDSQSSQPILTESIARLMKYTAYSNKSKELNCAVTCHLRS